MSYVVVLFWRAASETLYFKVEASDPRMALEKVCRAEFDMDYLDAVGYGKPYSAMGVYVRCQ